MAIDYTKIGSSTNEFYEILKYVYGTGLTNQFADEKTTYNQFPVSERKPRGIGYRFGVRAARAQGVGARLESAKLPDPLVGKFEQCTILPKYIYGVMRITGPAIEASKGDTAAFVDGLSDQVDDIYQSVIVDLNRQSWGDGWGHLGTVSAANANFLNTAVETLTLDNDTEVRYIQNGMLVDLYTPNGADPIGATGATVDKNDLTSLRISKVDPVSHTITIEASSHANYAANHPRTSMALTGEAAATVSDSVTVSALVIAHGARDVEWASTDTNASEMMGLNGIYDDGSNVATFEGLTVSSFPWWEANILGNSSVARELSMDLMLRSLDLTRRMAGAKPGFMRMGLGQRRKYANLLMPDVRFQPTILKGGYETLTFAGGDGTVTIVVDPMARPGKIFFEPEGVIQKFEMTPLGWGNLDQQMHWRSGYDEWDMFLRIYTNLGCEQRNSLTLLKDLVEPTLF